MCQGTLEVKCSSKNEGQELQLLVAGAPSTLGSTDQRQIVMLVLKYALTDPLVDSRGTGNAF